MKKSNFGKEVTKLLPLISREFTRRQNSIFIKSSLTVPQMFILEILAHHEPVKMSDLAKKLNLTMSAVTAIVDKMIKLKLVERERPDDDRRVVKVALLNKGKELNQKITKEKCTFINDLFSCLSEKDKDDYLRILKKLYDNLKKEQ